MQSPETAFLGRVREGDQEQNRRVCDVASTNIASAESIPERSEGYAMLLQRIPLPQ